MHVDLHCHPNSQKKARKRHGPHPLHSFTAEVHYKLGADPDYRCIVLQHFWMLSLVTVRLGRVLFHVLRKLLAQCHAHHAFQFQLFADLQHQSQKIRVIRVRSYSLCRGDLQCPSNRPLHRQSRRRAQGLINFVSLNHNSQSSAYHGSDLPRSLRGQVARGGEGTKVTAYLLEEERQHQRTQY